MKKKWMAVMVAVLLVVAALPFVVLADTPTPLDGDAVEILEETVVSSSDAYELPASDGDTDSDSNINEEEKVQIPSGVPGDINNDEAVNISDVQALLKYVNGQDVYVNDAALDVNSDGIVNISDVQTLLKFVNEQDVIIHYGTDSDAL